MPDLYKRKWLIVALANTLHDPIREGWPLFSNNLLCRVSSGIHSDFEGALESIEPWVVTKAQCAGTARLRNVPLQFEKHFQQWCVRQFQVSFSKLIALAGIPLAGI